MCRLSYTWCARNDNVWILARHVGGGSGGFVAERLMVGEERSSEKEGVLLSVLEIVEVYQIIGLRVWRQ